MQKKLRIFSVTLLGCLVFSCSKTSPRKGSGASASSASSTDVSQATKGGAPSGSGGLSGLEALLGGLAGKGGLGGGGAEGGEGGAEGGASAPADPNAAQWASEFGESFLSFQIYDPQKNFLTEANILVNANASTVSDTFECPGDSLIAGFRSLYDMTKGDRQMQPFCQFFNDASGKPMVRGNCSVVSGLPAGATGPIFKCTAGKFLAGFKSTWNATSKDRAYDFECCDLQTEGGVKMAFLEMENPVTNLMSPICETYPGSPISTVNHLHEVMDSKCAGQVIDQQTGQGVVAATVLETIIGNYYAKTSSDDPPLTQNDRVWAMQCCAIGPKAVAAAPKQ